MEKLKEPTELTSNSYINFKYETEDIKVADLIDKGFSCQEAESWLRKMYINRMFEKYGG